MCTLLTMISETVNLWKRISVYNNNNNNNCIKMIATVHKTVYLTARNTDYVAKCRD